MLVTAGIGAAGFGAVTLTDTGDKAYNAVRRTARVVSVLYSNIRDRTALFAEAAA